MNKDNWKDIEGYEGLYKISDLGYVNSLCRLVSDNVRGCESYHVGGKILKPKRVGKYLGVCLSKNGVTKTYYLHRLVAAAFIPNPQNKREVNHKNGIKTDNRLENLEWCSSSENKIHAIETGLKIPITGEHHHCYGRTGKSHPIFGLTKENNPKFGKKGINSGWSNKYVCTVSGVEFYSMEEVAKYLQKPKGTVGRYFTGKSKNLTTFIRVKR